MEVGRHGEHTAAGALSEARPVIRAFGRDIPETLEDLVDVGSALLVWDMQHAIAGRVAGKDGVVANVRRLIDAAHATAIPVLYSQHYSLPLAVEDLAWIRAQWRRSGMASPEQLSPLAVAGTPEWEFLAEVTPDPGDIVLPKTRPSLFVGTPAREILAAHRVMTLMMTGVTTDRGIVATALHAVNVGVLPVVVSDACGSYTEESHRRGLETLEDVATLTTADEITEVLRRAR